MEETGRAIRFAGKLGLKILEGALEGLIKGMLKCFGPERLSMFVESDWNILEGVFYGLYRPPIEAYKQMDPREVMKAERVRRSLAKTVLPVIGMARNIASRFPAEAVEKKVTAEWLLGKGEKYFPEIVDVVEKHGDKGRAWVERQAEQIRLYLTGRIVYHPGLLRFVTAEEMKAIVAEAAKTKK